MTTNVTVEAHCTDDTIVEVVIEWEDGADILHLKDGEKTDQYVYDDRVITVREVKEK